MPDAAEGPELVAWPRAAASAAIFRGARVLIAERGAGPMRGMWSLPGGKIEPGETAAAAAIREIQEETGLDVALAGLLDLHEVIRRNGTGDVQLHYIIAVHYGTCMSGEPRAATDISDARFVRLDELSGYRLTDGAVAFIHEAHRRLGLVS
jgi:ADP-ribose pyrophosphatase YjhB (NUDIX family)